MPRIRVGQKRIRPRSTIRRPVYRNLADYLYKTDTSQRAFASFIGVDPSYITKILKGDANPTLQMADDIVKEANITFESLVETCFGDRT